MNKERVVLKTMRWDRREPCKSCPYRKDAPIRLWDREEFERLLKMDQDTIGAIYACHGTKSDPDVCAGWLLNQRKRECPSIALRLATNDPKVSDQVIAAIREVHDGGHPMFRTIKAMCRANGARADRLRQTDLFLPCVVCLKPFRRKPGDHRSKTCNDRCYKIHVAKQMKTYRSRYPRRGND